jgi:hypothetical protein
MTGTKTKSTASTKRTTTSKDDPDIMSGPSSVITVSRTGEQWLAYPEGRPELGVRGGSESAAVGRLILAKARRLGVLIRRVP